MLLSLSLLLLLLLLLSLSLAFKATVAGASYKSVCPPCTFRVSLATPEPKRTGSCVSKMCWFKRLSSSLLCYIRCYAWHLPLLSLYLTPIVCVTALLALWHCLTCWSRMLNIMNLMHAIMGWIGWGGLLLLVSIAHSLLLHLLIRFWPKADIFQLAIPANGGVMVERWWVDDCGNELSSRFVFWVGQPAFGGGLEGPCSRI